MLGFHGCDLAVVKRIVFSQKADLRPSGNSWDWLGSGVYFWENDPVRAMQFAIEGMRGRVTRGRIEKPAVLGAVIDFGRCCNLFDQIALQEMRAAHLSLSRRFRGYGLPMPINTDKRKTLDREVIDEMHALRAKLRVPAYQTVRGPFPEGDSLYPGTGITEQNHIQIAVRDASCIRGYFLPRLQL